MGFGSGCRLANGCYHGCVDHAIRRHLLHGSHLLKGSGILVRWGIKSFFNGAGAWGPVLVSLPKTAGRGGSSAGKVAQKGFMPTFREKKRPSPTATSEVDKQKKVTRLNKRCHAHAHGRGTFCF